MVGQEPVKSLVEPQQVVDVHPSPLVTRLREVLIKEFSRLSMRDSAVHLIYILSLLVPGTYNFCALQYTSFISICKYHQCDSETYKSLVASHLSVAMSMQFDSYSLCTLTLDFLLVRSSI